MTTRAGQSGVTLIEMLVALSVFSLIGIASFSMLDTVVRTDRQTAGRLEQYSEIDLALRLFEADVLRASPEYNFTEATFSMVTADGRVTYSSGEDGLTRQIKVSDRPDVEQNLMPSPYLARWKLLRPGGANASDKDVAETAAVEMVLVSGNDEARVVRKLVRLTPVLALPE